MKYDRLKELAQASEINKALFEEMASRDRPRKVITLSRYRRRLSERGIQASNADMLKFFTALDHAQAGTLKLGRGPSGNRFIFDSDLRHIGSIALGQAEAPSAKETKVVVAPVKKKPAVRETRVHMSQAHTVTVRVGRVSIEVPADDSEALAAVMSAIG